MEDKKKITIFQFITLITVSEIMHQYTYLPILHTIPNNQDSWIVSLIFIPYVTVLCLPILFLLSKFKNICFYDMMNIILGKIGGKIATFFMCIFFCFCNIACLVLSIIFLENYILLLTPTIAITIAILIPVVYISYKGLSTICRLSTIIFFSICFITVIFLAFSFKDLDFQLLKPVMAD